MRIAEAAKAVGCTQRAIKFYEEKGLLSPVARSENGYRDYTEEDVRLLHEIQAYRKLGIGLADIKRLLAGDAQALLRGILEKKRAEADAQQQEIAALEAYLTRPDAQALDEAVDFASIADAMRAQLPGFFGSYLAAHFAPYLNTRITTPEQQDAYRRILAFWDDPKLRLPLTFRLSMLLMRFIPQPSAGAMDARIQAMLNPSDEVYARMREQTLSTVRMRRNPLVRYSPGEVMKRRMMRALKDCGYYDVFIPEMKRLSPAYRAYHDALSALNDRLCRDLGLHYDSDFNLVI